MHNDVSRNLPRYKEELSRYIEIESVSTEGRNLDVCAQFATDNMRDVGFSTRQIDGYGAPVVYGEILHPEASRTVLLYGHYDVQPADNTDLWDSAPFVLTERDGRLWGRGIGDNKGQHFAHWKAIELLKSSSALPAVNIKMMLDGEEEVGSPNLNRFVGDHRQLLSCDFVYTADGPRIVGNSPILLGGCRGTLSLKISCRTAVRDCHSGGFGGNVPNAALVLIDRLNRLFDTEGRCHLPDFYKNVKEPRKYEKELVRALLFDPDEFERDTGVKFTSKDSSRNALVKTRLHPYCNISSLRAGYLGQGFKNIIPSQAEAHVDIRLVPDQDPLEILSIIRDYFSGSDYDFEVMQRGFCYPASRTPCDHPLASLITSALEKGFGQYPVLIPSAGGSLPDYVFTKTLGVPSFITGYATHDERNHAPNKNLTIEGLINGIVSSAQLLLECGEAPVYVNND